MKRARNLFFGKGAALRHLHIPGHIEICTRESGLTKRRKRPDCIGEGGKGPKRDKNKGARQKNKRADALRQRLISKKTEEVRNEHWIVQHIQT